MSNYCKNCYELTEKLEAKERECEELKQYKSLFEKTRNLWIESRMNNYKLLDEIKDLKDSLKRTICQSECYKHKKADKLKQTLAEIEEIAKNMNNECFYSDFDCKDCDMKNGCTYQGRLKILQKISECEVEDEM